MKNGVYEKELFRLQAELVVREDGIILRKYWFSVSDGEQERRFRSLVDDPMRQWKLSPLLSSIPYEQVARLPLELPGRPPPTGYVRTARSLQTEVPDHAATIS